MPDSNNQPNQNNPQNPTNSSWPDNPNPLDIPPVPDNTNLFSSSEVINPPKIQLSTVPGINPIEPPKLKPTRKMAAAIFFSHKTLIPSILGIIALIVSIGVGIILIRKPQDIREKAVTETGITEIQCLDIRAYRISESGSITDPTSWTRLSSTDLSGLKAGDIIYFTVRAQSPDTKINGGFDQVEFTINGDIMSDTTLHPKPGTGTDSVYEFYYSYTIPDTEIEFTIKARVHHQTNNTWY